MVHCHSVVGITGYACAGKGEAARQCERLGASVVDVDAIGHAVLLRDNIREQIVARFGEGVADEDGTIDRQALAGIVFTDSIALADLESIIHPAMRREVASQVNEKTRNTPVVIDAAVLYRMKLDEFCDAVLLIDAEFSIRLKRAERRHWDETALRQRDAMLHTEMNLARERADYCIPNNESVEVLRNAIVEIWKEVKHGCKEKNV